MPHRAVSVAEVALTAHLDRGPVEDALEDLVAEHLVVPQLAQKVGGRELLYRLHGLVRQAAPALDLQPEVGLLSDRRWPPAAGDRPHEVRRRATSCRSTC
jgi:hypothetical protein